MDEKKIYSLIPKVMKDIGAIEKGRKNEQQGYKFRGIDDVYNAANAALSEHGVFCVPEVLEEIRTERTNKNGTLLFYTSMKVKYTFFAPDGSSVSAIVNAEGFDSGDKATYKALSGAQKYAFLQIFCIPTEEQKDVEYDSHEIVKEEKQYKAEKPKRSDWYYSFRDSFDSAKTSAEIEATTENIKKHRADISEDEYKDLLTAYNKAIKRIAKENK